MKVKVTVLKQSGVTGLKRPGTSFFTDKKKAIVWKKAGLVSIEKELKTEIETKELKVKPATKQKAKK